MQNIDELKTKYDEAASQSAKWQALLSGWQIAITQAEREIADLMSAASNEGNARILELEASIDLMKRRRVFYEDSGIKTQVGVRHARAAEAYRAAKREADENAQRMADMVTATSQLAAQQATGPKPAARADSRRVSHAKA